MDTSDIFGEDVRDSSHLQIVSSEEEDVPSWSSLKGPGAFTPVKNLKDSTTLTPIKGKNESNSLFEPEISIKSSNHLHNNDKLDRQVRLGNSQDTSDDGTQNIIDEINKIFEKPNESQLPEESGESKLLENGKKASGRLKRSLLTDEVIDQKFGETRSISIRSWSERWPEGSYDDIEGDNSSENGNTNTRLSRRLRRPTKPTSRSLNEDHSENEPTTTDSSYLADSDEDFDPSGSGFMTKMTKRVRKNGRTKSSTEHTANNHSPGKPPNKVIRRIQRTRFKIADLLPMVYDQPSSSVPFNVFLDLPSEERESDEKMFCLKFKVVDANREPINDVRLDNVYIKSSETIGKIAHKLGEMYNLSPQECDGIRIIIDGEAQNHNLQIGDPELFVEDKMQIDVKFPSKEDLVKRAHSNQRVKPAKSDSKNVSKSNKSVKRPSKRSKKVSKRSTNSHDQCVSAAGRISPGCPQSAVAAAADQSLFTYDEIVIID